LRQLYAIIPEKNNSSIRLFAKTGYRKSGLLEEWLASEDSFFHGLIMQKLNS
jgi:diamine N-acetyltransferase